MTEPLDPDAQARIDAMPPIPDDALDRLADVIEEILTHARQRRIDAAGSS